MESIYQETQREKVIKLISEKNKVFYGGNSGKYFMGSNRDFVLTDSDKNFYQPIKDEAIEYFDCNGISWWGGKRPPGHTLSSQIACLNHLFALRKDRQAVLSILKSVSDDFVDIFKIETDRYNPAYIQFEAVSDTDHLNEVLSKRGSNCTSIDALIYAKHVDGTNWLVPIEWKYTEHYQNQNKATEGAKRDPLNCKGEVRKRRYTDLINESGQLRSEDHFVYYFEPFYQLMRQTLWAEQMIKNKEAETIKADNYLHIHVVPKENEALLNKKYKCSGLDMEGTWRNCLKDNLKYRIISPEDFLQNIETKNYSELIDYLVTRYWTSQKRIIDGQDITGWEYHDATPAQFALAKKLRRKLGYDNSTFVFLLRKEGGPSKLDASLQLDALILEEKVRGLYLGDY